MPQLQSTKKKIKSVNKSPMMVVIGASAGGLQALSQLLPQFLEEWNATVFVVLHLSKQSSGDYLIHRLQPKTSYLCKLAVSGETIKKGTVYIAPPDSHMLVTGNKIQLGHGPAENRWRPSIDVLFRSAAVAFGNSVTGIILTGLLDDGTAGMSAIQESGGTCMVQDPEEAEYSAMPHSVMTQLKVDYCLPIHKMGETLAVIAAHPKLKTVQVPKEVIQESHLSETVSTTIDSLEELGKKSLMSCPDCGGRLWEIKSGKLGHYRCHIGHSYSEKDLLVRQAEQVEQTLWMALRIMEERKNLMSKILQESKKKNAIPMIALYEKRGPDLELHIERMKKISFDTQNE